MEANILMTDKRNDRNEPFNKSHFSSKDTADTLNSLSDKTPNLQSHINGTDQIESVVFDNKSDPNLDIVAEVPEILEKNYLTKFNKFGFAAGGFGQNLVIGVVNTYILFFLTDIARISLIATSALMLGARLFDAFNDPLMGTIVDKTRTKIGKLRPYLAFAPIPLLLLTVMLYLMPTSIPVGARVAYYSIIYILWGLVYTIGDVPFWGLASAMTPNPKERLSFITFSRLFHSIGGALPMLLLPLFEIFYGEKQPKSYFAMGIFAGIIGASLFSLAFFGSTERVKNNIPAPSFGKCFQEMFKNKPLLVTVIANAAAFARAIPITAGLYISNYLMTGKPTGISDSAINTILVAGFGVAGFAGMLFTPALVKKFEYRTLYMYSCIAGAIPMAILAIFGFLIGPNMILFVIMYLLMGLPYGLVSNLNYAMIAESVDYAEWKSGRRTEGISASMQTFMNKIMTTLQNALIPLMLLIFKFTQPSGSTITPVQSELTKTGLLIIASIVPMIAWIINLILIKGYPLHGEYRKNMYIELNKQRKATQE